MKLWKIYTSIYITLVVIGMFTKINDSDPIGIYDIYFAIVFWGAVFPLVGIILDREFLKKWLWKILFILQILLVTIFFGIGIYVMITYQDYTTPLLIFTFLVFLYPSVLASYTYSYKRPKIWTGSI